METKFLVIFIFLFLRRFGRSSNTMIMTSSNVTCIGRERQALLAFKQTITDAYNLLSTWSGVECCEWRGVGCGTRNGHVVKLDLRSSVPWESDILLKGKVSPSLQNLKHLRYLDLSMNEFSGNIPEFLGSFERLEYLNLSFSGLDGVTPHHLGNLTRLQYLDLRNYFLTNYGFRYNGRIKLDDLGWVSSLLSLRHLDFSGITIANHTDWFHPINMLPSLHTLNLAWSDINIPSVKFVNFTSLNSLDLSHNYINSTIPVWLSNLTGLMHLNLQENNFHGKVPDFLGMFSALASFDLSYNFIDTSMPDLLCNLSSLVYLDLSQNMFSGPILVSLGLLSRLEKLYLGLNQLSGNIPMSLGQLLRLEHLDLSSNQLSGNIPMSLGLLLRLEKLDLSDNRLSGNIPMSHWQLSNLRSLDLSFNSLVGVLSDTHFTNLKNINYLDLSSNSLALNFSSQWIPPFQLQIFSARSCNIGPHFPKWLRTQTNLQKLDLSNSSIGDTIPEWFESILSHILYLDLSNNQIVGKLPRFHFDGSNQIGVRFIMMNSNKFEGSLATFPSFLDILDLSDNLLSGHVPQTKETLNLKLTVLKLSKNRFIGSIPVHLCKAPSIMILDLSQNNFSGRIPRCFGNLINLNVIDLANNTIIGVVPSLLGSLRNLESLLMRISLLFS